MPQVGGGCGAGVMGWGGGGGLGVAGGLEEKPKEEEECLSFVHFLLSVYSQTASFCSQVPHSSVMR